MLLLVGMAADLNAAVRHEDSGGGGLRPAKPAVLPNTQLRVHDVGKVWMSITNFGFFGSQDGEYKDYSGKYLVAPGFEYPGGTNLQYLFQGALWIGAQVDTVNSLGQPALDTLVSIGNDGWWGNLFEMFPDIPPGGNIKVRSTRPSDVYPYGDTLDAKSEQDYIAVYTDTFTTSVFVDPDANDGRPHMPLHISITERSYAWSYEYAEDFILFDFDINNIGRDTLKNVWVGMYIDADVYHVSENPYGNEQGAQDDICGFDSVYIVIDGPDTSISRIRTAWIADNDGQPYDGAYDYRSPRGVSGVRVVRTPLPDSLLETGFNWWISNTNADLDWGPRRTTFGDYAFPGGGKGTPGGDKAKYKVMSNREFDYDQIWCNNSFPGWIAPPTTSTDLANGYDTRYLFSFGPFPYVYPGDTLKLTTAYIGGEEFHSNPANYLSYLKTHESDTSSVRIFYNNLNFQDFATNSQWADWVYDNPGVDTDPDGPNGPDTSDGYRGDFGTHYRINSSGDTIWFKGDGVPDFAGPPPPPSPKLTAFPSKNKVRLEWNGSRTENTEDSFLKKIDFEGYRIYKSATGRSDDYTLLGDFDIIDFDYTYWDTTITPNQWKKWNKPPRKIEEFPDGFDPDVYRAEDLPEGYAAPSTYLAHWVPYGWNRGLDDIILNADSSTYTYDLDNLSEAQGLYFAVTSYDFGNPITKLSSLESAPSINATLVYPMQPAGGDVKVAVYPNPYIITNSTRRGGYLDMGWEDRDGSGNTQFDRRIMFAGLPVGYDIKIFTIDGDLVKELKEGDTYYEVAPGVCFWDLISRNTQAVVSGVYIYSIDGSDGYHEIGKLAIIK